MLLLLLPRPEVGGGLGDRDGCRDEFGVETRDLADVDVGVSDLRFESSTWAFESTCAWTRQFVVLLRRGLELFSISDAFRTFSSSSRTRNNLWRHTRKVTSHDAMISNRLSSQACPILIGGSFLSDLDKIERKESENEKCLKSSNQVEADDRDSNAFRPPLGH